MPTPKEAILEAIDRVRSTIADYEDHLVQSTDSGAAMDIAAVVAKGRAIERELICALPKARRKA